MDFHIFSLAGLIISVAYFFAGFVDSVCGGGGLITVPTLMLLGVPAHMVMGTNQSSIILGSFAAFWEYIKKKKIHFLSAGIALPFALVGSYFGSNLNMILPERYLQYVMIGMIPMIAIMLLLRKDFGSENHIEELSKGRMYLSAALVGFAIGAYQGFYGPGSGMFAMFAFSFFLKLDMLHANGNTKFVVSFSTIVASLNYAFSGNIVYKIAILATIFNIFGSQIGAKYAIAKGSKGIRPVMFFVIVILLIKVISDL